jgi:ADP-ribose pyrophosphatase
MKIPKQSKRVFKGEIFDVYHWEQKMFDGSHQTFEILKRPDTVEIIPTVGDKILIAEQEQPTLPLFYSLFGGRVDAGEKPLETAKRELLEESGYSSDGWELIHSYEPYANKMDWTVFRYIARNCKKTAEQNLDAGEKIKVLTISFDEFLDIVDSEKFHGKDFANDIFRIKQDKNKLKEFKNKLFTK